MNIFEAHNLDLERYSQADHIFALLEGQNNAQQCGFRAIELLKLAHGIQTEPRAFPVRVTGGILFPDLIRAVAEETGRSVVVRCPPQHRDEVNTEFRDINSAGTISTADLDGYEYDSPSLIYLYNEQEDCNHVAFFDPQGSLLTEYQEVGAYLQAGWRPIYIIELKD